MGCSASKAEPCWQKYGGDEFEAALAHINELGGSAVRLLDACYLIKLAENGGKLLRRQDLPEEAFVTLPQLKRMGKGPGGSLRVVVVSHPWLQPDHPDPRGDTLRLLARVLKAYIAKEGGTCGVFLDFCSLMQKGPNGEERTPAQMKLFGLALSNLSDWYSHHKTMVLKLTKMPEGASPLWRARRPTPPTTMGGAGASRSRRSPTWSRAATIASTSASWAMTRPIGSTSRGSAWPAKLPP